MALAGSVLLACRMGPRKAPNAPQTDAVAAQEAPERARGACFIQMDGGPRQPIPCDQFSTPEPNEVLWVEPSCPPGTELKDALRDRFPTDCPCFIQTPSRGRECFDCANAPWTWALYEDRSRPEGEQHRGWRICGENLCDCQEVFESIPVVGTFQIRRSTPMILTAFCSCKAMDCGPEPRWLK